MQATSAQQTQHKAKDETVTFDKIIPEQQLRKWDYIDEAEANKLKRRPSQRVKAKAKRVLPESILNHFTRKEKPLHPVKKEEKGQE